MQHRSRPQGVRATNQAELRGWLHLAAAPWPHPGRRKYSRPNRVGQSSSGASPHSLRRSAATYRQPHAEISGKRPGLPNIFPTHRGHLMPLTISPQPPDATILLSVVQGAAIIVDPSTSLLAHRTALAQHSS